jgi:CRP-like cAMP-binding protein
VKLDSSAFVAAPELLQALEGHSTAISCGEDRLLFNQGDTPTGVFILSRGETTLSMCSPASKEVAVVKVGAGSLLGLPGLIGNVPYSLTAVAHTGAEVRFVSRDKFTSLMQTDPRLALKILAVLAAEVSSARRAILER